MEDKTTFFYYAFRNILFISLPILAISALVLSMSRSSAAELSSADNLSVSVPSSCTLSSIINGEHSRTVLNGTYESGIGQTILTTYCNDENGYVVYAIGSSNNELGNNKLISNRSDETNNYDIVSGTATSGNTSNWAMKLSTSDIDSSIINTNVGDDTPTINTDYNKYNVVPNNWTVVVSKPSGTVASTTGSSFTTTYATYVSTTQPAGSYLGQVRYLLAHPYTSPNVLYMQDVAEWKDSLKVHDTVLALDKRDYKAYYVTKLLDGHIWMTQNLAIDLNVGYDEAKNPIMRTFTSEDTDLNTIYDETNNVYPEYSDGYTIENGVISWTPANSAATRKFTGTRLIAGWQYSNTTPASASKTDDTETGHSSLGNYYNWTAAVASNNSSTLTQDTLNNIQNNPKNSICPKGWRLPTVSNQAANVAGSTNEFARLNYIYNNNKTSGENTDSGLLVEPLWFVRSGRVAGDTLSVYGSEGFYHSSISRNIDNAYAPIYSSSRVNPTDFFNRRYGLSLRCLARTED